MVDGQVRKPVIGAVIQARMQSSRLPGKILMPLPFPNGKPLLQCIYDSVKRSSFIHEIVIATSINSENDSVESFAKENNMQHFRGSEDDVFSRFISIIEKYKFEHVVRLTGDNPIVDIESLELIINSHLNSGNDYTKSEGLPIGANFEIFKSSALLDWPEKLKTDADREHVTPFFNRSYAYKKEVIRLKSTIDSLRLTVDYPSDYAFLSFIFSLAEKKPDLKDVEKLIADRRWMPDINKDKIQKKSFNSFQEELEFAKDILEVYGLEGFLSKYKDA